MTTTQHNANIVVNAWLANNDHYTAWGKAAHPHPPSTLQHQAAEAFTMLAHNADQAVNKLLEHGFLPNHSAVTSLQHIAEDLTSRADSLTQWANALHQAEQQTP